MESQEKIKDFLNNLTKKQKKVYELALKGDAQAQCEMGELASLCLLEKYSIYWYRKAAMQNYVPSFFQLGFKLDLMNRIEECCTWYVKLFETGDDAGMLLIYEDLTGGHMPFDYDYRVINYFTAREKDGDKVASEFMNSLRGITDGTMSSRLEFINMLLHEEKQHFEKAMKGNPDSQTYLAILAENDGLYHYAEYWAHKAAKQGYVPAYIELGVVLEDYLGQDDAAAEWYMRAAEADCQEGYTFLYYTILEQELEPDTLTRSINLLLKKAQNGHRLSIDLVETLKENLGEDFGLDSEYHELLIEN